MAIIITTTTTTIITITITTDGWARRVLNRARRIKFVFVSINFFQLRAHFSQIQASKRFSRSHFTRPVLKL